jgi:two-component system, cell cycle response regulator DivK
MPTRTHAASATSTPVVVLVQDHIDTSEMYCDFLNFSGFRAVRTGDADEGFDLAIQCAAAVVVTDFWLAGNPSGSDLCHRLKQDDRTRHIPTLLLTGSSQRKQVEASLAAGCAIVRLTPYLPDALAHDIRALIARKPVDPWPSEHGER